MIRLLGVRAASTASAVASPAASLLRLHAPTRVGNRVRVVLRETLDTLGEAGEEVSVAPGYARNFLIPQQKAVYATASNRARFAVELSPEESAAAADARASRLLRARVAELTLIFKRASVDGKKLYAGVTAADIVSALAETPLKNLGVRAAGVRLQDAADSLATVGDHAVQIEPRAGGQWCTLSVRVVAV